MNRSCRTPIIENQLRYSLCADTPHSVRPATTNSQPQLRRKRYENALGLRTKNTSEPHRTRRNGDIAALPEDSATPTAPPAGEVIQQTKELSYAKRGREHTPKLRKNHHRQRQRQTEKAENKTEKRRTTQVHHRRQISDSTSHHPRRSISEPRRRGSNHHEQT